MNTIEFYVIVLGTARFAMLKSRSKRGKIRFPGTFRRSVKQKDWWE